MFITNQVRRNGGKHVCRNTGCRTAGALHRQGFAAKWHWCHDDAPLEFTTTPSGLKYRVLRKSDDTKPLAHNTVTVNYRGWLDNGREFDSSYKSGEPISFPLGGVIAGWTEGMQLVGNGGMIELWIPSDLGYGAAGSRSVPPNANLHFIVELQAVK